MQYFRIFICSLLLLLLQGLPAQGAADVSPAAQKRMSIVLSQATRSGLYSFHRDELQDPKNINKVLSFAISYIDKFHFRSKTFRDSSGMGPIYMRPEDVNEVLSRFFEFTLPPLAEGKYGFVRFDGKFFSHQVDMADARKYAYVQQAKEKKDGSISVQGVLDNPEYPKNPEERDTFTAVLKPIIWNGFHTYAIISIYKKSK